MGVPSSEHARRPQRPASAVHSKYAQPVIDTAHSVDAADTAHSVDAADTAHSVDAAGT